jgi:hypothetical protein
LQAARRAIGSRTASRRIRWAPTERRSSQVSRGEKRESGELLLLGAPRTAGVRFCCPVRPEPRFCPYNLVREDRVTRQLRAPDYRWHLCFGPSRWSHSVRKQRLSAHVDPSSAPSEAPAFAGAYGGAAGYRPRVRCAYFTPQFIAIAGQARQTPYRPSAVNLKPSRLHPLRQRTELPTLSGNHGGVFK